MSFNGSTFQSVLLWKKWNFTQPLGCFFCHLLETLLHVVTGCRSYLEENRYTWCHSSALLAFANFFRTHSGSSLYVDLPCFFSPSIITGDIFHSDRILVTADKPINDMKSSVLSIIYRLRTPFYKASF